MDTFKIDFHEGFKRFSSVFRNVTLIPEPSTYSPFSVMLPVKCSHERGIKVTIIITVGKKKIGKLI